MRRQNAAAARRNRGEEAKLEQQEVERNQHVQQLEHALKNTAGLTKKEVQKMEKKLEKAQMAAA